MHHMLTQTSPFIVFVSKSFESAVKKKSSDSLRPALGFSLINLTEMFFQQEADQLTDSDSCKKTRLQTLKMEFRSFTPQTGNLTFLCKCLLKTIVHVEKHFTGSLLSSDSDQKSLSSCRRRICCLEGSTRVLFVQEFRRKTSSSVCPHSASEFETERNVPETSKNPQSPESKPKTRGL